MKKDYEIFAEELSAINSMGGVRITRSTRGMYDKIVISGSDASAKMQKVFMEKAETGEEVEPVNVYIGGYKIAAVLERAGETVALSFEEDGTITLDGVTFDEDEVPDVEFDQAAFVSGTEKLYSGERTGCEGRFLPLAKRYAPLFGDEVEEYRTDTGRMVVGANGFAVMELQKEEPISGAEEVTEDVAALFADEVPFVEEPKEAKPEKKEEEKPREEPKEAKPVEAKLDDSDEEQERVIRLMKGESFACYIGTKTLSAAIAKITAAIGSKATGPVSVAAKGKAIGLMAYAEPVQVMTSVPLKAAAFEDGSVSITFYLNLERLANMVRALESVEEELRLSIKETKVYVKGEETHFTLDVTKEGIYLTDKPEGIRAEFDTESFVRALNASCFYDEKATRAMCKAVFLSVVDGKPVMYSLDGHMASRAFFKGAFSEDCTQTFALPPCVTKFRLVGAEKVRVWFGERMLWLQCNQTLYTVRYTEATLLAKIEGFFATNPDATQITVQAGEMKSRVQLVDGIVGGTLEAAVKDSVINLSVNKTIKVKSGEQEATVASLTKPTGPAEIFFSAKLMRKVFGVFDGGNKVTVCLQNERSAVVSDKDISVLLLAKPATSAPKVPEE